MKNLLKILLILSLVLNLLYLLPAYTVFHSISTYPQEWQGGIDMNSTIVWFATITLGYTYLYFLSLLAIFGIIFGFKRRKAAFRLLLLPGFIGIVFAGIWLVLFIMFDAEWPASWQVVAVPFVTPLFAYISGRFVRRKVVPKES
jgi:hypothetical protein